MLISNGADCNVSVGPGLTPLYNAAFNGHADLMRLLAEENAAINMMTEDGFSPLYISCQQGHASCVHVLLELGATPNAARPQEGATPLYIASQNGRASCVGALLDSGQVTVDLPMYDGSTPLMIACFFEHVRIVEMLLRAGASLEARDQRGRGALEWARERNDALVVALVQEESAARAVRRRHAHAGHAGGGRSWFATDHGAPSGGTNGDCHGGTARFFGALSRVLLPWHPPLARQPDGAHIGTAVAPGSSSVPAYVQQTSKGDESCCRCCLPNVKSQ